MKLNKKPLMFAAAVMGAAASSLAFAPHASAAPVTVPNFSFETGLTPWAATSGSAGTEAGAPSGITPADGTNIGFSYGYGVAEFSQSLTGTTIVAGTTYTLSVYCGKDTILFGGGAVTTSNIALLGNGAVISGASLTGISVTGSTMVKETVSFVGTLAETGETLGVQMGQDGSTGFDAAHFDDVTVDATAAAVPEPSTIALMLGGIGALALVRRMRRTA